MSRWPLREALEHFYLIARERASEQYRQDLLIWAVQAPYVKEGEPYAPPERPEILGG